MNQATNLIQWKNLTNAEEVDYNFKEYSYEFLEYYEWKPTKGIFSPNDHYVYRLVIESDKWYYAGSFGSYGVYKVSDLVCIENSSECRPANASEISQP